MIKPPPWNWSVEGLAPEFRGIAARTRFLLPYWEGRGAGMPVDLVQGLKGTPSANKPDWSAAETGGAMQFVAANFENISYGAQPFHWCDEPGVFWYGAPNENVTSPVCVFEIPYTSAEPFYSVSLRYNDGVSWERYANVQWNQGGTRYNFGGALRSADGVMPLDRPLSTWIVSIRDGEQTLRVNGVLAASRTETGVVTYNNQVTSVNRPIYVGNYATCHQSLLLLVEGGFTRAEAELLHADPFGIIRPHDDAALFAGLAGGLMPGSLGLMGVGI